MTSALKVVAPGLSTTVQDGGRVGWRRLGVPVSGALDRVALAAANVVAGNRADAAALECLYQGPVVEVDADSVRLALAGTGASLEVVGADGAPVQRVGALESVTLRRGARARVLVGAGGVSAYLAVEGGVRVAQVLGSRSTYTRGKFGGLNGRALAAGDALPIQSAASERGERRLPGVSFAPVPAVRVTLGPQDDHFTRDAIAALLGGTFTVTPASDRMGLRLAGPRLAHAKGFDIASDATVTGAIQVPGDGQPIVLLADGQTTGGYPKIATVISADVPALARIKPGAKLAFRAVTVAEAEAARQALERDIASWPQRLERAAADTDSERLLEVNLISGVADAES
ncbi:MAG TPA: biotin-dependent carboxyltransferase family protein [Hyphomicrobiaceae bacterium]|nr:biotin-dependent carboxyltransferase family protein [Hyphomicrobiaceae bacterium]